jgi:hypothetical protein
LPPVRGGEEAFNSSKYVTNTGAVMMFRGINHLEENGSSGFPRTDASAACCLLATAAAALLLFLTMMMMMISLCFAGSVDASLLIVVVVAAGVVDREQGRERGRERERESESERATEHPGPRFEVDQFGSFRRRRRTLSRCLVATTHPAGNLFPLSTAKGSSLCDVDTKKNGLFRPLMGLSPRLKESRGTQKDFSSSTLDM